ncbi:MAG TPA: cytochrome c biogenesis protein CcsA [Bacteroidota bacterium]|nr:cytochrome c biogenesis protein CcsA [Bacteroidota bacterium]
MKIVKIASIVLITFVIVVGMVIPMVAVPQTFWQFPLIPGLEEKARNIFYHVPVAWVSVLGFLISLWYGFRYLQTNDFDNDLKSVSAAGLGFMFCVLATVTGSIWAKFNWGSFWNWDPRETSIVILLLIYGAYFALRSALGSDEVRARLSAVYSILAGLTAPFFIFVMPRLVGGLHPGAQGDTSGSTPVAQLHMPLNMRLVFFLSLLGFSLFFFWLWNVCVRAARLEQTIFSNKQ